MSATKTLNISTSMSFSKIELDGIEDLISKYYIYSIGGTLFYSNNTFAGSICLYYSGDTSINFVANVGKATLANTNGNINVQYGNTYGYFVFDNTAKNLRLSDLKKINRVRLCANGSWHNNYTNITGFNIYLYDVLEVE